ncbi:MAG: hypothetical protein ISR72_03790, partial [Methylobacter sp.]|nr:hypothetical protein [Methylobacter sp.]
MSDHISEALDNAIQEAERARQAANNCEDFSLSAERSQRTAELEAQAASQYANQAALARQQAETSAESATLA